MKRILSALTTALVGLACIAFVPAADPPPDKPPLGSGTLLEIDAGYFKDAHHMKWASLPTVVEVIGSYDHDENLLVCVRPECKEDPDQIYLVPRDLKKADRRGGGAKVVKLVRGNLESVRASLEIREEPPAGRDK